ncbi:MAG: TonB-dependent receptor, partial [Sulfuritalea sp.]|nr:TonB-dependent receptor [Sulfuritalea sp.]
MKPTPTAPRPLLLALAVLPALAPSLAHAAEADRKLDEISVTATREARATAQVPQAIAVVGKEALAEKKMFNLKEAMQDIPGVLVDSKNGGFD